MSRIPEPMSDLEKLNLKKNLRVNIEDKETGLKVKCCDGFPQGSATLQGVYNINSRQKRHLFQETMDIYSSEHTEITLRYPCLVIFEDTFFGFTVDPLRPLNCIS